MTGVFYGEFANIVPAGSGWTRLVVKPGKG